MVTDQKDFLDLWLFVFFFLIWLQTGFLPCCRAFELMLASYIICVYKAIRMCYATEELIALFIISLL